MKAGKNNNKTIKKNLFYKILMKSNKMADDRLAQSVPQCTLLSKRRPLFIF